MLADNQSHFSTQLGMTPPLSRLRPHFGGNIVPESDRIEILGETDV